MHLFLNQFKHQLNLRKIIPTTKNEIGSILKDKRKKMNLTLEEGAEGICSVSYLSKVENNLIVPSDLYLNLFQKKYHLNDEDFININFDAIYDDIIESFIHNKKISYSFNPDNSDYKTKLCNYIYFINLNKFEDANRYFDFINPYLKNFTNKEILLYTLATSKLLKSKGFYKDAFDILSFFNEPTSDEKLELLIKVEMIILANLISNHPFIMINLEKTINLLISFSYYHLVEIVKYNYFNYLLQFINEEDFNKRINNLNFLTLDQKNMLSARFYYLNTNYHKALSFLNEINQKNEYYMLKILILNKLNQLDLSFIESLENKNMTKFEKQIVNYLKIKVENKTEEMLDYIREEILKYNEFPSDYDELHFWYEEGVYQLRKNNFYKEALVLNQLIINELKHLTYYSN